MTVAHDAPTGKQDGPEPPAFTDTEKDLIARAAQQRRTRARREPKAVGDLVTKKVRACRTKAKPLAPFEPAPDAPTIQLSRQLVDELATREHGPGPDHDMMLLRWCLLIALLQVSEGFAYVFASPADVERHFVGRAIGQAHDRGTMERAGMTARTLRGLRDRLARYVKTTPDGRVALRTSRVRWYAYDYAFIVRACFELSNSALRTAFAAAAPSLAARNSGRHEVRAGARACSHRARQSPSYNARGWRELRIGQVSEDNRPGSRFEECQDADGTVRVHHPTRRILLDASACLPLGAHDLRLPPVVHVAPDGQEGRRDVAKQTLQDTMQLSPASRVEERAAVVDGSAAEEERPTSTATPPPSTGTGSDSASMQPGATSPAATPPAATPAAVGRVAPAPSDWQRLSLRSVRQVLAESPHIPAPQLRVRDEDARRIAETCGTVAVLRRVLRTCGEALGEVPSKVRWLAQVVSGWGVAVRAPDWSGPWRSSGRDGQRALEQAAAGGEVSPPSESRASRACRRAMRAARGEPRALEGAALAMRATGEREGRPDLVDAARTAEVVASARRAELAPATAAPSPSSGTDRDALRRAGWADDGTEREGAAASLARWRYARA